MKYNNKFNFIRVLMYIMYEYCMYTHTHIQYTHTHTQIHTYT